MSTERVISALVAALLAAFGVFQSSGVATMTTSRNETARELSRLVELYADDAAECRRQHEGTNQ